MEALLAYPMICIFVPLEVELVLRYLIGGRPMPPVSFCEEQLGNNRKLLIETSDAELISAKHERDTGS